jgi:6-phosphofructokinase 1
MVETVHHHGGCFLGLKKTPFHVDKIMDNLIERGINQIYLIGGSNTFKSAALIYEEIKRRKLKIGICVLLKAINKDVAIFDTCFGFESAVEETQRFIEMAYVSSKSYHNTVCNYFHYLSSYQGPGLGVRFLGL